MASTDLHSTAQLLVAYPGGIAALDESEGTFQKRADSVGMENTFANRQAYRSVLARTPNLHGAGCNGVILHPETLMQPTPAGIFIADILDEQGIVPVVKVDEGLEAYTSTAGYQWLTKGLDGLGKRLDGYMPRRPGATKWRVQYAVGNGLPTQDTIDYNSLGLAAFGLVSQERGLVPILEPEVFADYGNGDHTIDAGEEASKRALGRLFEHCMQLGVDPKGAILKTNFVTPGRRVASASAREVAERTLNVLYNTAPPELAGVAFLSGGLPGATEYLNATCALNRRRSGALVPTYSFGREVQGKSLELFAKCAGPDAVQYAFVTAVRNASLAVQGKYRG